MLASPCLFFICHTKPRPVAQKFDPLTPAPRLRYANLQGFIVAASNAYHFFACVSKYTLIQIVYFIKNKKANVSPTKNHRGEFAFVPNSGEAGIRTRARVAPTNGLANRPLQPTWVLLQSIADINKLYTIF